MQIYSTFDNHIVKQCQYYGGFLPTSLTIDLKFSEFLRKLSLTKHKLMCSVSDLLGQRETCNQQMAECYKMNVNVFACKFRNIIYNHFDLEIEALFN